MQSRPADLDILIADLGSYDYAGLSSGKSVSTANSPVATANPQGSGVGMGSTQTVRNGPGLTRKLSLEDLEWHSKDNKHNRSGSNLGIKFDGNSCKFNTKEGDDGGYTDFRGSPSISRTDSMGNDMYGENNGYDDYGLSNRGRSQSKDFDSLTSVSKLIRSTKKKLQSIEELEGRMKDGSLHDFNDEQVEKISKKEATQAEMKRLQLIFMRLEGEERVKAAAMAVRERERDKEKEKEKAVVVSQCTVGKQGRDGSYSSELPSSKNISTVQTIQLPARPPASSPSPTITPTVSSQSIKSRAKVECKTSDVSKSPNSDLRSDVSSTVIKKTIAVAEPRTTESTRPVEVLGKTLSSKAITAVFVPPSFNDWLKVTDEFVPECPKIDQQSSLDNKTKIEPKTVWGLKATAPQVRPTSETGKRTLNSNLNPGPADPLPPPPHEISISHIGLQGRTVLSPSPSKARNQSSSFPSSTAKTPIHTPTSQLKVPTSIQSNEGVKTMNRDQSSVEQQPVQCGSYSLSLADLLVTPTKKTNKQKREAALSVPATDKVTTPEPLENKQKPSCPWLSPSIASPQEKTQYNDQIDTPTSMKVKQKTLSEIQVEEEAARLQSNLISLKGNNNPWYQERRKRADSIEAVIRSQAEEKILDEANRIEEENAVRQVDLLKKKERRERGKSDKKKQETKSDAKPNVKVAGRAKKNSNTTINETSITATEQPHSSCSSSTCIGSETAVTAATITDNKSLIESESGCGRRSPASKGQSGRPKDEGAPRPNQRNTPAKECITSPSPSVEDGSIPFPVSNVLISSVSSPSSSSVHNPTRTVNARKSSEMKKTVGFHNRKGALTGASRQQGKGRSAGEGNSFNSEDAPTAQGRGRRNQQSHRDRSHRGHAPCDQNTTTHLRNSDNSSKLSEHIDSPSCVADVSVN